MRILAAILGILLAGPPGAVATAVAQDGLPSARLEGFVRDVARLWETEDVEALVSRISTTDPLRLDTGSGTVGSDVRHAAAALRELFGDRETLAVQALQVTLAGSDPPSGFGQLLWNYRDHGAPAEQVRSVYVATSWQAGRWRIAELRLMP